jgi:hypothetical protein
MKNRSRIFTGKWFSIRKKLLFGHIVAYVYSSSAPPRKTRLRGDSAGLIKDIDERGRSPYMTQSKCAPVCTPSRCCS